MICKLPCKTLPISFIVQQFCYLDSNRLDEHNSHSRNIAHVPYQKSQSLIHVIYHIYTIHMDATHLYHIRKNLLMTRDFLNQTAWMPRPSSVSNRLHFQIIPTQELYTALEKFLCLFFFFLLFDLVWSFMAQSTPSWAGLVL